jgi:UPF0176 protein
MQMNYYVIAYYIFTQIEDPLLEIKKHKDFFKSKDMKGRIYISEEGINAQLSGLKPHALEYIEWMKQDARFKNIDFKLHEYHDNAFAKMTVKYRKQLVALDEKVDMADTGVHLNSMEWDQMLKNRDENTIVIDTRNRYEWEVGHFEGADLPELETFRQFKGYAKDLRETRDPKKTKVMMYCTGGIRCEIYSSYLKKFGFEDVYQLNGGVIRYGLEKNLDTWRGKLFVFDDRMVVPIANDRTETLTNCAFCDAKVDHYYNCANMDCNGLFIACKSCLEKESGCCCDRCKSGRVRPLQDSEKPFRKLPKDEKLKLAEVNKAQ